MSSDGSVRLTLDPLDCFIPRVEAQIVGHFVTFYAGCKTDLTNIEKLVNVAVWVTDRLSLDVITAMFFDIHRCSLFGCNPTSVANQEEHDETGVVFNFPPLERTGGGSLVRKNFKLALIF